MRSRTGSILLGLFALVVAAAALRSIAPWLQLRARYPGSSRETDRFGTGTVEVRTGGRLGTAVFRDAVAIDFGTAGVALALRGPMGVLLGPLGIPAQAVGSCQRRALSGAWTGVELWLPDANAGVGFPREDEDRILAWCASHGIVVTAPSTRQVQ